jgi:methylmalonyl-CoA mutase
MADPQMLSFVADFPPATRDEWRKLVEAVLKGAPFERLTSRTYDGLAIEPLAARRSQAQPLAMRPGATAWQIMARIDHPDPARANAMVREELDNGATGIVLVAADAIGGRGFGLPASEEAFARALAGVEPRAGLAVEIDLSPSAEAVVDAMLARGRVLSPPAADLRLGRDPLGARARDGGAAAPWSAQAPLFARRLATLSRDGFRGRLAAADGRVIHDAGGSEAQELAFVLGVALAYLRALEAEGVALEAAQQMIFFRLSADADQFLTIAKFRALRKLWARVQAACGLAAQPAFVAGETAWRMMARRDPCVNILRATIAAFAAALGGADAIAVLPFTAALGLPAPFARRIARNSQLVLLEEAHLAKVADPAAGAGALEDLTDALCHAAWALLQEVEAAGGVAAALDSGLIAGKVAAVAARRAAAVARGEDALTGVNLFPDLHEGATAVEAPCPRAQTPRGSGAALRPIRLAAPFEVLRDASDRALEKSGARPKILLATLGTPADSTARATFAANFFAAGGIEAVGADAAHGREAPALAAACRAAGTPLVCLCASDQVYDKEAAAAARALGAAGARHIFLAGRPGAREAALRAAGVQSFVYEGCDMLATLASAYATLGIEVARSEIG